MLTTISIDRSDTLGDELTYELVLRRDDDGLVELVLTADDQIVTIEHVEDDLPMAYLLAQLWETNGGWFVMSNFHDARYRAYMDVEAVGMTREDAIRNYLANRD